jgi:hypothetical protein
LTLRDHMSQEPLSTRVTPLRTKILRVVAYSGAPLLLLVGVAWPELAVDLVTLSGVALALLLVGLLTFIDPAVKLYRGQNLVIVVAVAAFAAAIATHFVWRAGRVVAEAKFDPGIAPFDITVREVPVPVTRSHHFIVTLKRGQYPVTSFRYFWTGYTPERVRIEWTRLDTFKVVFDERYVATCSWSWGGDAIWTMQVPPGAQAPGDRP